MCVSLMHVHMLFQIYARDTSMGTFCRSSEKVLRENSLMSPFAKPGAIIIIMKDAGHFYSRLIEQPEERKQRIHRTIPLKEKAHAFEV